MAQPEDPPRPGAPSDSRRGAPSGTRSGAQAETAGHSTLDELLLLTTHGLLHLLGFDHAEPEDEKAMFGIQRDLLLGFHVADRAR